MVKSKLYRYIEINIFEIYYIDNMLNIRNCVLELIELFFFILMNYLMKLIDIHFKFILFKQFKWMNMKCYYNFIDSFWDTFKYDK